jgi:AcrR family transcriptional regulator
MDDDVKRDSPKRAYHAPRRNDRARATRGAILEAARNLFISQGYAAASVADIAERAGVSVDTIYAAVGRKPGLLRQLVESALSGTDETVPALEREYVTRVREAGSAALKLGIYAEAVTGIQQRLAPIFLALREAAATDDDCANLWTEISERRARNMRLLAADLRATGELRSDLSDDKIADIIWTMNATEYWVLLVKERGWTPDEFADWLADAWKRLLLE